MVSFVVSLTMPDDRLRALTPQYADALREMSALTFDPIGMGVSFHAKTSSGGFMRLEHCDVKGSTQKEWMVFAAQNVSSPFLVTMNHGNAALNGGKHQEWYVVQLCHGQVQMVSLEKALQFLPVGHVPPPPPPPPHVPAPANDTQSMLVMTLNQIRLESEQRSLAFKAEMDLRMEQMRREFQSQMETNKDFSCKTRDLVYETQSNVKALNEKVETMAQQIAMPPPTPTFVAYFVNYNTQVINLDRSQAPTPVIWYDGLKRLNRFVTPRWRLIRDLRWPHAGHVREPLALQ